MGAPAVRRARLLESAAAGPARRAAPGRHPAAARPRCRRRPAAAGQDWEASVLTQLLAELTRAAPNQPAVRAALDELLAAALPRIVDLAITTGPAELADLASLALQLAPQPDLAAPLAEQMPELACGSPRLPLPSPASKSPNTG